MLDRLTTEDGQRWLVDDEPITMLSLWERTMLVGDIERVTLMVDANFTKIRWKAAGKFYASDIEMPLDRKRFASSDAAAREILSVLQDDAGWWERTGAPQDPLGRLEPNQGAGDVPTTSPAAFSTDPVERDLERIRVQARHVRTGDCLVNYSHYIVGSIGYSGMPGQSVVHFGGLTFDAEHVLNVLRWPSNKKD